MMTTARIVVYTTPYCPSCKSYIKMLLPACTQANISVEVKNAMENLPDTPITHVPATFIYDDEGKFVHYTGAQDVQKIIDEYKAMNR